MKVCLFYDCETTGLPLFKEPSDHPDQPHIVQLAAALVDLDTRKQLAGFDVIVHPSDWKIPKEVSDIHGITDELARDVGIREELAVDMLLDLHYARSLPRRIAHNESFDARIIRIALKRIHDRRPENAGLVIPISDEWKGRAAECTMRMATPILNLPPTDAMLAAGRRHAKSPNLGEAYEFFTGKALENAHNAMADVQACIAVYFAILDRAEARVAA